MARIVHILCHTEGRGVQYDQMGLRGKQEPELFVHRYCPCNALIHECRV